MVWPFGAVPVLDRDAPFPGFGLPARGLLVPEDGDRYDELLDDLVEPEERDPCDDREVDRDERDVERDLLL